MKRTKEFLALSVLIIGILFLMTACPENTVEEPEGPVHFTGTLSINNEQVWMPNYNTGKLKDIFLKFTGNRDNVDVIVMLPDYSSSGNIDLVSVGSGKIENGLLSLSAAALDDNNLLLESDDLFYLYFNDWYENGNGDIKMTPDGVKGNIITLVSLYKTPENVPLYPDNPPVEAIIKEGFSGTDNSLTGEYTYFIYVNNDCIITSGAVIKENIHYTFNAFSISLKKGWNIISKTETYTSSGDTIHSISVKNPNLRWVMMKI